MKVQATTQDFNQLLKNRFNDENYKEKTNPDGSKKMFSLRYEENYERIGTEYLVKVLTGFDVSSSIPPRDALVAYKKLQHEVLAREAYSA